jgi:hypothetical protein
MYIEFENKSTGVREMTPKEMALKDYQAGVVDPVAPLTFTHEQKTEYYKEFLALVDAENRRLQEELRAGI